MTQHVEFNDDLTLEQKYEALHKAYKIMGAAFTDARDRCSQLSSENAALRERLRLARETLTALEEAGVEFHHTACPGAAALGRCNCGAAEAAAALTAFRQAAHREAKA